MKFQELNGEKTRRVIDSEQRYATYRDTIRHLYQSYRGSMQWKAVNGQDYLYHTVDTVSKGLGPRAPDTETIASAFNDGRKRLRARRDSLRARIESEARVDRAMGLGRAPSLVADILRKLDRTGLLGKGISVVGTNAIFAYEQLAGGHFSAEMLATGDVDLLFDSRRRLRMLGPNKDVDGLAGLLKKVDSSFEVVAPGAFRASNDQGFMVDLIQPMQAATAVKAKAVGSDNDLQAAEIEGLAWLQNVPQVERIVLDERGMPFAMPVPDPRAFALHKLWLSDRPDREPAKARRDRDQARLVASIVQRYLPNREFDDEALRAIPAALRARAGDLLAN